MSALKENERYLDSIQGRIDQFNNALQSMWNNVLDDDLVKFIVQAGTELLKLIDNLGVVKTLVIGIGTYLIQKNFKGDLFGGLFNAQTVDEARDRLKNLQADVAKLQKEGKSPKKIKRKQNQADTLKASIDKYDELSKQLTKNRIDADAAKKALDDYNESLAKKYSQKKNQGKSPTAVETAEVERLQKAYDGANDEVIKTEVALKQAEVQAKATGTAGLNASNKIKTGFISAGKAVWKFAKEMTMSMAYTMAITAVFEAIGNIGKALGQLFDKIVETPEELQEKLSELQNELSSVESELNNLQSELKDTDERIEELLSQGSLTFVEQEELNKLKSVSAELKAQIGLQETLRKSLQQSTNSASIEATNAYLDTSFMSEQSKTERQEKAKETGSSIGQIIGTVAGGIIGTIIGGGITLVSGGTAAIPGAAIGIAAGSAIAGWIGGEAGSAIAGASYDSEQSVEEAMNSMLETRAKLKEEQDEALAEGDAEAYNEATEALRTYDAQMAKHISQIQQNYNAMDWATASPEDRKAMMEYADWLDKYNISMGTDGAKSNAIARIFGDEAQGNIAKARDEINKLKEDLAKAKKSGKGVDKALAALEGFELNLSEDEVERLREMGIYLYEVEDYFKDVVEAESEFVDMGLEDVAKDISKITDGLDSLKTAFDEVIEEGVLTAKTILSIKDALGIGNISEEIEGADELTSAWAAYLDTMMSGAATTEEMITKTEQLTQAWLEYQLNTPDGLSPDTKLEYVAQLRSLGVANAEEYVNDLLQKNMVKEIEDNFELDEEALREAYADSTKDIYGPISSFEQLDDNYIDFLAEQYNITKEVSDDVKQTIMERYGVEEDAVDSIIDKLKEKAKFEQEIAKKEKQKVDYDKWRNGDGPNKGILALREDVKNAKSKLNGFNPDDWRAVDLYFDDFDETTHYRNKETKTNISIEEYNKLASQYEEYAKLKAQYDKLWAEGERKGYIVGGEIVDPNFQAEIDNLRTEINGITTDIDEELTVDIQLKLDLQNKSELVDDIQNVFDTLVNAQKEYEENGHISVDTLQSLLQLEPKYLDLLVDEEGNLNLTKDALYNVARARIIDMGIQSQKNILEKANQLASKGSADALREQITVMENANEVGADFVEVEMAKIRAILAEKVAAGDLTQAEADAFVEGTMNQIKAVQVATQSALDNLNNSLSSSGNTATAEVKDAFKALMDYYDNRISANQAKYDQIQNDIDYLEAQGKMADANYYKDQIALLTEGEESKQAFLEAKLQGAADRLRELEAAGQEGSDEWWEAAQIYNDTLSKLDYVRDTVLDLQDAIGNLEWSKFEELNNRIDNVNSKLETMRDLIAPDGEEDWFDDEGNWTEKGVAVLGSYVQSLEYYKNGLNEATEALETFQSKEYNEDNADWFADNYGIHSEQEYYDYLQKLTDEQYNYASSVSDTEQDIAGMWEFQVDAVEEYFGTLIESYNDYIDSVKEALDAERDLYDFKKNVQKQSKDIATLERRIASLSGSTNASDIAERRKLESELYESRESLNDTYYDHSKQSQQEALEAESVAYEETMNRFVENLRTNLDLALRDMDTFIQGVTSAVTVNAPTILGVYNSLGIALDSAIVDPWQSAIDAMGEDGYSGEEGLGLMNSWVAEGGVFSTFSVKATDYLTSVWDDANVDPGNAFATAVSNKVSGIVNNIKQNVETAKGYLRDMYDVRDSSVYTGGDGGGGGYVPPQDPLPAYSKSVEDLQKILNAFFSAGLYVDGIFGPSTREAVKKMQKTIGVLNNGVYNKQTYEALMAYLNKQPYVNSWFREAGFGIPGPMPQYAKGTTGTTRDQWALTDEPQFGDELVLVPTSQGNLSYMRKGTGVVPADLTANLMEWGQFTPDSMNLGGGVNVNMINNAVIKPQYDFSFDSLVHVDHCDQSTIKDLEKMVDTKIDKFSKDLNYSLKRFSR